MKDINLIPENYTKKLNKQIFNKKITIINIVIFLLYILIVYILYATKKYIKNDILLQNEIKVLNSIDKNENIKNKINTLKKHNLDLKDIMDINSIENIQGYQNVMDIINLNFKSVKFSDFEYNAKSNDIKITFNSQNSKEISEFIQMLESLHMFEYINLENLDLFSNEYALFSLNIAIKN